MTRRTPSSGNEPSRKVISREKALSIFRGIQTALPAIVDTQQKGTLAERRSQLDLIIAKGRAAREQLPLRELPSWDSLPFFASESDIVNIREDCKNFITQSNHILSLLEDEEYWALNGIETDFSPSTSSIASTSPKYSTQSTHKTESTNMNTSKNILVVHGRNQKARAGIFDFLRAVGLKPLEWEEIIRLTGKTSPFIGEALDSAFDNAQAILVLLTGDDEAQLRPIFRSASEPSYETALTPQARPNVLFEAGMALGRNAARTIIIETFGLRPFSDIAGRHLLRMKDGSAAERIALLNRLRAANCDLEVDGKSDYLSGDYFQWLLS